MSRPSIPADIKRQVLMEAGHRCAIPTCRHPTTEIAHIEPWAKVQEHKFENLIALCPNCHTRYDNKEIDRKSMVQYKASLRNAQPTNSHKSRYLSDEDTELGTAIHYMAMFSAWAKWFAAQHLALNEHKPISESSMMSTASSLVLDAAMNGKLSMRGRPAGSIQYEAISRETWRLIAIKMEPHPATLWKAVVIPRSDVDQERVQEILEYDSIILSSREFEQLWPRDDRGHDRARMKELKKAKRLGADAQAVEKLAKGNMAI